MLRIFPKKSIMSIVDIPITETIDTEALKTFLESKIQFDGDLDW